MKCADANKQIDKYNDDTGKYDQTVFINGESVSTLSTSKSMACSTMKHLLCLCSFLTFP